MAELSRDGIFAAKDIASEFVEVPEWAVDEAGQPVESPDGKPWGVWVRALDGEGRDAYEASLVEVKTRGRKQSVELRRDNARAKLVALTVTDGEGGPLLFTDAKDVVRLGRKSAVALSRLVEVAGRLSAVSEEDVEELVEDFEPAQSEPSSSDSL